jgi:cation:H+ antiporter
MAILFFILGLVFLVLGAEILVKGASRLAGAVGISPLVIGLTVVAFGTSAPEMAVSAMASLDGQADLAMGNVVGSNIFNVLFILGLSALVTPLAVSKQLIRLDVPLMIAVSLILVVFAWDGGIQRWEAALLLLGIITYTVFQVLESRRESAKSREAEGPDPESTSAGFYLVNIALIIGGLGCLVLGSDWLVDAAITFATYIGVSERVIGLTIVAAGTSLPELATSVMASIRGERDIAVGNVVGSNVFNILAVLGLSGMFSPSGLPVAAGTLSLDIPVMVATAIICFPLFFTGFKISRLEGAFFVVCYVAYTTYLVIS